MWTDLSREKLRFSAQIGKIADLNFSRAVHEQILSQVIFPRESGNWRFNVLFVNCEAIAETVFLKGEANQL